MVLFQGWLVALAWTFTAMMIVTLVQRLREARRLLR
jgi:hypothetical protein